LQKHRKFFELALIDSTEERRAAKDRQPSRPIIHSGWFDNDIQRRILMAQLLDRRLRSFQGDFTGKVIAPDDPEYDTARSVWNGAINRRPAVIARCSTPAEVVEGIRFARDEKLEISVRGGGHNFAGSAVCDDGLMIDLSAMRQVSVDSSARRAVAGGGATWGDG
jgi:hypothetical protein